MKLAPPHAFNISSTEVLSKVFKCKDSRSKFIYAVKRVIYLKSSNKVLKTMLSNYINFRDIGTEEEVSSRVMDICNYIVNRLDILRDDKQAMFILHTNIYDVIPLYYKNNPFFTKKTITRWKREAGFACNVWIDIKGDYCEKLLSNSCKYFCTYHKKRNDKVIYAVYKHSKLNYHLTTIVTSYLKLR
jgi:hypothetical protein